MTQDGPILVVLIDNESAANALTRSMMVELRQALVQAELDDSVAAVVLSGTGDRHFCAGVHRDVLAERTTLPSVTSPGLLTSKPRVCAVNGIAAGGGLALVADADVVVATRSAGFIDGHLSAGVLPMETTRLLSSKLPRGEVLRLVSGGTGVAMSAVRAYALGLVQELTDDAGSLSNRARELAIALANLPAVVRTLGVDARGQDE